MAAVAEKKGPGRESGQFKSGNGGNGGRPSGKGGKNPPPMLLDYRAVWKGGKDAVHEKHERRTLQGIMNSQPKEFLKSLREMEDDWRKEKRELERERAAKAEKDKPKVEEAAKATGEETAVEELCGRLISELKGG